MRQKGHHFILVISFVSFLFFPSLLISHYNYIPDPNSDVYFGHISYTEVKYDGKDPQVLREGRKVAEIAVLNMPLVPGDTILTTESRRCEIQFDTGTIIRLDLETELKIETVLAQSLSSRNKVTNLILHKGQIYIMYRKYNSKELFQVITPSAAVKMKHRTVAMIKALEEGGTDVQVKLGKVYVLYGADESKIEEKRVDKLERLIISKEHEASFGSFVPDTDFEEWNEDINENFIDLHRGQSFIPKPILRYPKAVVYFAQKYSYLYGEWVWDSYYGYVWKPSYSDYYPTGIWHPYYYGKWREINGHLFWVPEEPWGWVPYHLGVWIWDKNNGWLWIPGSAFAPAWVTWTYYRGWYGWRPWTLWDWYYYPYGFGYNYYSYLYYPDYFPYWREYNDQEGKNGKGSLRKIHKGRLKKKTGSSYPLPKRLKNPFRNAISALKKGDKRIINSIQNIPQHIVFVKGRDLNAQKIQERVIHFEKFLKQRESLLSRKEAIPRKSSLNPHQSAVRAFKRNTRVTELRDYVISSLSQKGEKASTLKKGVSFSERKATFLPEASIDSKRVSFSDRKTVRSRRGNRVTIPKAKIINRGSPMRFRDWNPDARTARRMGVEITYSSRANEIRCPALNLSSKNVVVSRGGFSYRGSFYSHSSSASHSGSYSGSSGGSSAGGSRGSSGGSGSRGGSSSGGGSKGGGGGRK